MGFPAVRQPPAVGWGQPLEPEVESLSEPEEGGGWKERSGRWGNGEGGLQEEEQVLRVLHMVHNKKLLINQSQKQSHLTQYLTKQSNNLKDKHTPANTSICYSYGSKVPAEQNVNKQRNTQYSIQNQNYFVNSEQRNYISYLVQDTNNVPNIKTIRDNRLTHDVKLFAQLPHASCIQLPSNMLVYLRDRFALTFVHASTMRQKLQIKLAISPTHSLLTPGQPILAMTLYCQVPRRVTTRATILTGTTRHGKSPTGKAGFDCGSATLKAYALQGH